MSQTDQSDRSATLRTPIVAVLGHVDHGKTSLLDRIRGSTVIEAEAGAITQHIGATEVPLDVISDLAGSLVDPDDFDLPGLLFIDTPGHHSFSTLRARGGALADIAILVIDINDGCQPQTLEALEILRRTETPFVVAANKIDTMAGWKVTPNAPTQTTYQNQSERVRRRLDEQLYELIGELSSEDFPADLYWQLQDFRQTIGVVPVSAETGEGIPDLLTVLMGLSQRYMRDAMAIDVQGPGAGTVLEVTDELGFGTTIEVVLYDGQIRPDDTIVVGGTTGPIVADVRALLKPDALAELRSDSEFRQMDVITAASGLKIAAADLGDAMAGAPVRVVGNRSVEAVIGEVEAALASFDVDTEEAGVVVKADTLGSLEAMAAALEEVEIPILRAEVGDVAQRDVTIAGTADEPENRAILAFNVDVLPAAEQAATDNNIHIFEHDVIYRLVEDYEEYATSLAAEQQAAVLQHIIRPGRFQLLPDHVFRQNDPAVVGVEILDGTLTNNVRVGRFDGSTLTAIGELKGIQDAGEELDRARAGDRVSVAIDGPTVGRQIDVGDELWVDLPEKHAKILEQELLDDIEADERDALQMFLERRRRADPFWGK